MRDFTFRTGTRCDMQFLKEMLGVAVNWSGKIPDKELAEIRQLPEISNILCGWGRVGDFALIAEVDGRPVGAAWYRLWTDEDHSFGYYDRFTPEIGIGVIPELRRCGIGRALLTGLIDSARNNSLPALSLSVETGNPAITLYQSLGFKKVAMIDDSITMLLSINRFEVTGK